jgi:ActR/RegA family two-component response regulator
MLEDKPVLIVQDNIYLALDLCSAVEQLQGRVIGPVGSVADAMAILDSEVVAAAVVDCELPDGAVTPLVEALCKMGVPFVVQSANVPPEIAMIRPSVPVLVKPIQARDVASILAHEVIKTQMTK